MYTSCFDFSCMYVLLHEESIAGVLTAFAGFQEFLIDTESILEFYN